MSRMIKQKLSASITFEVKLDKDDFDSYKEMREPRYVELEKDLKRVLKLSGYAKSTAYIYRVLYKRAPEK